MVDRYSIAEVPSTAYTADRTSMESVADRAATDSTTRTVDMCWASDFIGEFQLYHQKLLISRIIPISLSTQFSVLAVPTSRALLNHTRISFS